MVEPKYLGSLKDGFFIGDKLHLEKYKKDKADLFYNEQLKDKYLVFFESREVAAADETQNRIDNRIRFSIYLIKPKYKKYVLKHYKEPFMRHNKLTLHSMIETDGDKLWFGTYDKPIASVNTGGQLVLGQISEHFADKDNPLSFYFVVFEGDMMSDVVSAGDIEKALYNILDKQQI